MRTPVATLARIALLALVGIAAAAPAFAQDPLKVAPSMYKLDFENERIRVMEVTFKPGEKIAPHSHPDHFVYVLSAGKLKITHGDGTSADFEGVVGANAWIPAETHYAQNIGTTEFRALVIELKEPAKAAAKAAEKAAEAAEAAKDAAKDAAKAAEKDGDKKE
jgi:quercetin dioxygenase-like cupin family protein